MKKLIRMMVLGVTLMMPVSASAAEVVQAKVLGMVCDFCARSMEKVFMETEKVEKVDVSLDTQTVTLTLKDGATLTDDEVKQGVTFAGYETEGITRTSN